ncbi:MAG: VWA domain-containing protein [Candidatus Diapherotrites archaeon]|nr:VWA domain-containing protein [Candidatus Diapherotrites archaeon]
MGRILKLNLFTKKKFENGFVFSIDALFAVILFSSAILILSSTERRFYEDSELEKVIDFIRLLENSGYIENELDENSVTIAATNVYNKIKEVFENNVKIMIEIEQYSLDYEDCRQDKNFETCFPIDNKIVARYGEEVPEDKKVMSWETIVIKKQPPGDCNLEFLNLEEEKDKYDKHDLIYFKKNNIAYFQPINPEEIGLDFNVNTIPQDSVGCDNNLTVNLSASIREDLRSMIDLMLVIDRSGSMAECTVVDGNVIADVNGYIGGGTRYCSRWIIPNVLCLQYDYSNWVNVLSFNITNRKAFEVLLEWYADAGSDWQNIKMYVEAPNGTRYGYYTNPSSGCYNIYERTIYLAIPSSLSQNGNWKVYLWNNNPPVPYRVKVKTIVTPKTKIQAVKEVAKTFIDDANWTSNDYMGLASYSSSATLDQPLTNNRTLLKTKIDSLNANGNTATGEGIYTANQELINNSRNNSVRFEVLLSDGKTNAGRSSALAAQQAKDNNIVIFTVGFGYEADENELKNIANITGGEYYYATDENVLREIYRLIAMKIRQISSTSKIIVPIPEGATVVNSGGGIIQDNNIIFDSNGLLTPGNVWRASYKIKFDCDVLENCIDKNILLPGRGTVLEYEDYYGNSYKLPIDTNVTIKLLNRDLKVDIINGYVAGTNDVYLDINVANIGYLDTNKTDLKVRFEDINGNILKELIVPNLCGEKNITCKESFRIFKNINIRREGILYATINENNNIKECPLHNYDAVKCYGSPKTNFYRVKYYIWAD